MQTILEKILAAAPDPLQLTDAELAKLSAYLKTHRRTVSLSAIQRAQRGDLAERERLNQDEARWAAWRCTLAYNVELRKAVATAPVDAGGDAEPGKGMTWQAAKKAAEEHCARNPFPGVKALAKIVGCSPSTMSKAIDRSAKLRARLAEHEAQRKSVSAGAMSEAAAASAKQSREPDPIDAASASTDDLFRRLLEQAKPSERAKLNAMTPGQRRELIATIEHDPDKAQTVRGPKR